MTSEPVGRSSAKRVVVYTDGGCQGNPGPGAWACVLKYGRQTLELAAGVPATTNNRMELSAAIHALRALNQSCTVELHTDSEYLRQGITSWIAGWKRNGWRTKDKSPVKNQDLWRQLDELASRHTIDWRWVKGHAGNTFNERCDQLAGRKMEEVRQTHTKAQLSAALTAFRETEREAPTGFPAPRS